MNGVVQTVARKLFIEKHGTIETIGFIVLFDSVGIGLEFTFTDFDIQFLPLPMEPPPIQGLIALTVASQGVFLVGQKKS
jgi:hypothetical protein